MLEETYESWLVNQQATQAGFDDEKKLWEYDEESQRYIISKYGFEFFDSETQLYVRANYSLLGRDGPRISDADIDELPF